MFVEMGIVLCLFNLKFFAQLDTRFTCLIWTVFCCVFCVLYCSVTSYYSFLLFFLCVLYCLLFLYCTVSANITCFSILFSFGVRQMPGYNLRRRGTARTSQISFKFFNCYVCSILCILCIFCV
jgi:hypothetical protein